MKFTFLGTGTSCGVPVLGCQCMVCQSNDPKDKRLRCAAMLETNSTRLLIDCGPDFRQQMMPYCFPPRGTKRYPGVPKIQMHSVVSGSPFTIGDINILPVNVMHGKLPIIGYRIDKFAYVTDIKSIDSEDIALLRGVDTLVVSALRFEKPHHSHFLVSDAIEFSHQIGAQQVYLTHVCHDMGCHEDAEKKLPAHFHIAYDNEVIEL